MSPNFRRGMKALNESRSNGKKPSSFATKIRWREDKEEKFLIFLNPVEEIPTLQLFEWVPVGTHPSGKTRYADFIYRKDPAIGENYDDLEDRLGVVPKDRTLAVAVELEPTFEEFKGRKRPRGFKVKTEAFTRKGENGDEEVTAPIIGIVSQSRFNFFGWVGSFNDSTAPIEETPLQVIRRGKDANTAYDFTPFIDQEVDFENLLTSVDNVGYLSGIKRGDQAGDQSAAALSIGSAFLEKYLNEIADFDRYKELVGPLTHVEDRFNKREVREPQSPDRPTSKFEKLRAEAERA